MITCDKCKHEGFNINCDDCLEEIRRGDVKAMVEALRTTLEAMRRLRGLAFTGSRVPYDRYPEKTMADEAELKASAVLKSLGWKGYK